jgi:hypothetical protein
MNIMTMTKQEQLEWNQQCYGCNIQEFTNSVRESFAFKHGGGMQMVIMSILSDAQEMIERGMKEEARQNINRAKFLLIEGA